MTWGEEEETVTAKNSLFFILCFYYLSIFSRLVFSCIYIYIHIYIYKENTEFYFDCMEEIFLNI